MKHLKKLLSIMLAGIITLTSLFAGAVISEAANIPYYGEYSENTGNKTFTVEICGLSTEEINFLDTYDFLTSKPFGFGITMAFNYGKTDQVTLMYSKMNNTPNGSYEAILGMYKGKFLEIKSANWIRINNNPIDRFGITLDTGDPNAKAAADIIKKCSDFKVKLEQTKNDKQSNFYGLTDFYNAKFTSFLNAPSTTVKKGIDDIDIPTVSDQVYTGKALTPDVKIKDGSYTLVNGKDYTISYMNNVDIGMANMAIKLKGNYAGSLQQQFRIVPRSPKLKASRSGSKIKLSWTSSDKVTKYIIEYSTDGGKTFKKLKNVSGSKKSTSVSLKKGKTYTFRIRSYKTVDDTKYYSQWSDKVKVSK